jgi:hypothetical protein
LKHSNFLISERGHRSFLWNVLAEQTVEVFIAVPFPAGKWSGKVSRIIKLLINMGMPCKLFDFIKRLTSDPGYLRIELIQNSRVD